MPIEMKNQFRNLLVGSMVLIDSSSIVMCTGRDHFVEGTHLHRLLRSLKMCGWLGNQVCFNLARGHGVTSVSWKVSMEVKKVF